MEQFSGRIAVVTGGGTGMGRELVRQLAADGCHVAMCDVSPEDMAESQELATAGAPDGTRVTTWVADVSDEDQVVGFRDAVAADHETDVIHLLFNNAGIGGGASLVKGTREEWDRVFGVDWGGVYYNTRAFLPMLLAADEGHVINTSSVNGLWASLGPNTAHTAYSAAKFAVRGFTEALITDFRLHAPHLHAHAVFPGHIGTSIVLNTARILGGELKADDEASMARLREQFGGQGFPLEETTDEQLVDIITMLGEGFRTFAPTTAEQAAGIILDAVRHDRWRVLVGDDAQRLDEALRADPENVYTQEFFEGIQAKGIFNLAR